LNGEQIQMDKPIELRTPRTDDRPLWNVLLGLWGYPAVLVANKMKLFDLLAERPLTVEEVCAAKGIARRPAQALLSICTSLELMSFRDGRYSLTALSEDYLLSSSPTYYGWQFDAWFPIMSSVWSPDSVLAAVMTDRPQGPFADPTGVFAAWHAEQAENFTRAMHSGSLAPALAWPKAVNLSVHRIMLDVGGGSGAHSIGAVREWADLRAVVFDQPVVCELAAEFAERYGLSERISAHSGDFFSDPFPPADLHFYGMIFHDWPPEQCQQFARKSFDSLPVRGRIIVHEMLFNDDLTGPFPVAAFNVAMLAAMPGQQYSGREITQMLREAGFTNIEVKPTFGYWSIVTGVKP
jgi:O-methyltransferase domain/Dimerisation domain